MTTAPAFLTYDVPTTRTDPPRADSEVTRGGEESSWIRVRRPDSETVVVAVGGELDMACASRFTEVVQRRLECTARTVVLDCSEVTFIDTSCAATLLNAASQAEVHRARLLLASSSPVDRMLRLLDATERFTYVEPVSCTT